MCIQIHQSFEICCETFHQKCHQTFFMKRHLVLKLVLTVFMQYQKGQLDAILMLLIPKIDSIFTQRDLLNVGKYLHLYIVSFA